jgi:hypothetical protein
MFSIFLIDFPVLMNYISFAAGIRLRLVTAVEQFRDQVSSGIRGESPLPARRADLTLLCPVMAEKRCRCPR